MLNVVTILFLIMAVTGLCFGRRNVAILADTVAEHLYCTAHSNVGSFFCHDVPRDLYVAQGTWVLTLRFQSPESFH